MSKLKGGPEKPDAPEHTPGPWFPGRPDMQTIVEGFGSKYIYSKRDNPDDEVAVAIAFGRDIESWDTIMANARLIAVAPELLSALESAVEDLRTALTQSGVHNAEDYLFQYVETINKARNPR